MREIADYQECLSNVYKETRNTVVKREMEELGDVENLFFDWNRAVFGDNILKGYLLKNISGDDKVTIESSKALIEHLQNEISKKEDEINGVNDRIIDGTISKELI